jgi:RNA polymerase sigma-70 factor (ECF subfamily)
VSRGKSVNPVGVRKTPIPSRGKPKLDHPEEQLLEQAVAGDEAALTLLLEQVGPGLHAELESRIHPRYRGLVDADDIWQVTCLEAFLRIGTFVSRGAGSFAAWLRRIGENNLRDAIRELECEKRPPPDKRIFDAPGDASYVMLLDNVAGKNTTVSRAAARSELKDIVEGALARLPRDYEQALRLYELEGLSAPDVAERMGRSHGAVRMLLTRARECMAEYLGSESRYL